jgi:hypothetical protein
MFDLSLGNWKIWYEKVWAIVYLVLSDTKVLEISFEKHKKYYMMSFCMTKLEFPPEPYMLFRLEKLSYICYLLLHWVLSSFVDSYDRFVMLSKSRSRTHHIYLLLLHWEYVKTCLPSRSTQKYSTHTLGANNKNMSNRFPIYQINASSSYCYL